MSHGGTSQSPQLTPALRDETIRWIADDVDARSRDELQKVLAEAMAGDANAGADLSDRMAGRLAFGTAGLRGPLRAGPNGMNTAVVVQTTVGVASWLHARGHGGGVVVVGYDARHGSHDFARAAAEVLAAAGFEARLLPEALPTPVAAFAVRHLNAVAGIQITASHNPPQDNGYKLYDSTGTQIIPPADTEIEREISLAPASVSIERSTEFSLLDNNILESYLSAITKSSSTEHSGLRIAATALHGVGGAPLQQAFGQAGFTDIHFVPEQFSPDPDFPTVAFPNPEEPGAADLLLTLAKNVNADVAIALDPDADRCAVGILGRGGNWRMLRGDETGSLLGNYLLSTTDTPEQYVVATTIVSSSMLRNIANSYGARYAETLTGFKWLARADDPLLFAYEEALGLCVAPNIVRDKDGIAAAIAACRMVADFHSHGTTVLDELDNLAIQHGVHVTDQISLRVNDLDERSVLLARLRENPPTVLAGVTVAMEDLAKSTDLTTDAVRFTGESTSSVSVRVIVRPSGTEPKLKTYLQVTAPVPERSALPEARREADEVMRRLRDDMSKYLTPST